MKLTLIFPNIGFHHSSEYVDEGRMEPLPLSVLAALTPEDIECVLYDDRMEEIPFDEPTDLVAISVEIYTARRSYEIAAKYRKIHLPGHDEFAPDRDFQHLEKRYFEVGDLGFPVWHFLGGIFGMCICNDRRWPETYRCMGLQDVEIIMLGYNTPRHFPAAPEVDRLQDFHNHLSLQAGAYQNGTWVIGVAKAGVEDGCELIGQSVIVAPTGEIVAMTSTMGDEVIIAECDLDRAARARKARWNWEYNREPRHYDIIVNGPGRPAPAED